MTITFPHMGNAYIAVKVLFEALGIAYIVPQRNNKKTLQKGTLVSPDEICLPFKIMMGNYMESIEKGADTILITGSCGPCRFGEYCELQMQLLKKLGYSVDFIVIDSYRDIGREEFWDRLSKLAPNDLSRTKKLSAVRQAIRVLNLLDELDKQAHWIAGYEIEKGECKQLLGEGKAKAEHCTNPNEIQKILDQYLHRIKRVRVDEMKNPLRISLIGEIYSMIEPFSNLFIEDKLMDYGVSSTRMLTLSWWLKDMVLKPTKLNSLGVKRASKPYLPYCVGGHAKESIAHAVHAKRKQMDGVIQIFPLGCMPEIVTKSILPSIQEDKDLPIMTLIVDEITGETGYITRIEAFLDMLASRKKKEVAYG